MNVNSMHDQICVQVSLCFSVLDIEFPNIGGIVHLLSLCMSACVSMCHHSKMWS